METINKGIYRIRGIFADGENKEFARLLGKKQNQTACLSGWLFLSPRGADFPDRCYSAKWLVPLPT
ncbi:MAG: hypothetical protein EOM23_11845 [Candidatus Moranbacteria bacterium]|nr:hypothetical protein [Candidatus Moranbacteria bacterium]